MNQVTGTVGIIAMAAAAIAVVSLLCALVLGLRLRRVQAAQRTVLGDERRDLVEHAATLHSQFHELSEYVQEAADRLHNRMEQTEHRLDHAVAYRSLVRYDAYGEMSGRQSTSIALLDATRSGIVLSSIHHRDQARLYAKQVYEGQAELELSPEESEALQQALQGGQPTAG